MAFVELVGFCNSFSLYGFLEKGQKGVVDLFGVNSFLVDFKGFFEGLLAPPGGS